MDGVFLAVPTIADDKARGSCCTLSRGALLTSSVNGEQNHFKRYTLGSGYISSPKKRALCISSNYRKDHFCREPKRMKRNRQESLLQGSWRLWKPSCVLFWSWFPYPWPPEGGQAAPANFLSLRDRDTNRVASFPTPTPLTIHTGTTKTLPRTGEMKRIAKEKQKTTKSFSLLSPPPFSCFKACNSLLRPRVN